MNQILITAVGLLLLVPTAFATATPPHTLYQSLVSVERAKGRPTSEEQPQNVTGTWRLKIFLPTGSEPLSFDYEIAPTPDCHWRSFAVLVKEGDHNFLNAADVWDNSLQFTFTMRQHQYFVVLNPSSQAHVRKGYAMLDGDENTALEAKATKQSDEYSGFKITPADIQQFSAPFMDADPETNESWLLMPKPHASGLIVRHAQTPEFYACYLTKPWSSGFFFSAAKDFFVHMIDYQRPNDRWCDVIYRNFGDNKTQLIEEPLTALFYGKESSVMFLGHPAP